METCWTKNLPVNPSENINFYTSVTSLMQQTIILICILLVQNQTKNRLSIIKSHFTGMAQKGGFIS